MLLDIAIWN
uniref:Uncharacterized protein n=1 Tax=Arundo donax TaxID=35708 RepID=A0A0A9AUH9_ARUDO